MKRSLSARLRSSKTNFDTSTDAIIKLKETGVSDKVIAVMLGGSSKTGIEAENTQLGNMRTTSPLTSFLGVPLSTSNLYVKKGDKVNEMLPIIPEISHSMKKHFIPYYFGPGDTWHYIRGEKSVIRLNEKKPIFYTKVNPSSFFLVKLSYESRKNIRYVISTGSAYRNTIPLKFNKKTDDIFEITMDNELELGEYAFVSSMTFFDFAIDGASGEQSSQKTSKPSEEAGN